MKKGTVMSIESREKMRLAKLGKKSNHKGFIDSAETIAKKRAAQIGVNNWNWKGGVNTINRMIRGLSQYREWRLAVYYRDDWTCQMCRKRGIKLEPHHIYSLAEIIKDYNITTTQEAVCCPAIWDINNGMSLCLDCHTKTDNYRNKKLSANIVAK